MLKQIFVEKLMTTKYVWQNPIYCFFNSGLIGFKKLEAKLNTWIKLNNKV